LITKEYPAAVLFTLPVFGKIYCAASEGVWYGLTSDRRAIQKKADKSCQNDNRESLKRQRGNGQSSQYAVFLKGVVQQAALFVCTLLQDALAINAGCAFAHISA